MKQLIQKIRGGQAEVLDVPPPILQPGMVLVQNAVSLISAGTERKAVTTAGESLIGKARARPDLVRQVLDKAQREGIVSTVESVKQRLDGVLALGYSSAGVVVGVSEGVEGFHIDDRVACAGSGYASHAEIVAIPKNLVVKLPEPVDFESAAFTTLGAIALQGIRLAEAKLGDIIAVIGLGLLGQLTVQMLKAAGCQVVGMDIHSERAESGLKLGADAVATAVDDFVALCRRMSSGHGVDAVLVTADTKSNQPIEVAGKIARERGIVVAVGAVGMSIPRNVYYIKELDFRISRSYGPGRYDASYEEKGIDYPYAYVRWTERRNMEAFVKMLASQKVGVKELITHRFDIDQATSAYALLADTKRESYLGVLISYHERTEVAQKVWLEPASKAAPARSDVRLHRIERVQLGVIGAGNFTNSTLLPAIKGIDQIECVGIVSGSGLNARTTAKRFNFKYCAAGIRELLEDPQINTIAILTRHHLHAEQVQKVLKAGKHVFVEKPLCLNEAELANIIATYKAVDTQAHGNKQLDTIPLLMVGFNRRFAPFIVQLKAHLDRIKEPLMISYRVNAGYIPLDHWVQDMEQGGGRLLGEGCHFVDLLIHLAGSKPKCVTTRALPDEGCYVQDNFLITLEFENGTMGIITYIANGHRGFGKEYIEVFGGGRVARLDDYRVLEILQETRSIKRKARLLADKGHQAEWQAVVNHLVEGASAPISFEGVVLSTKTTLAAYHSLQTGETIQIQ